MNQKFNFFKMSQKELKKTVAGAFDYCVCTCAYANCGGSSTSDNYSANNAGGLHSTHARTGRAGIFHVALVISIGSLRGGIHIAQTFATEHSEQYCCAVE